MVPKDVVQYRKNGEEAKNYITKDGAKKLEALMANEHPLDDIKENRATDVEIISITKETGKGDTYQIRWKEKVYEGTELKGECTMAAFVAVKLAQPKTEEQIKHNPFGIYIDDISWSKER